MGHGSYYCYSNPNLEKHLPDCERKTSKTASHILALFDLRGHSSLYFLGFKFSMRTTRSGKVRWRRVAHSGRYEHVTRLLLLVSL
jgi:hypothetical protein